MYYIQSLVNNHCVSDWFGTRLWEVKYWTKFTRIFLHTTTIDNGKPILLPHDGSVSTSPKQVEFKSIRTVCWKCWMLKFPKWEFVKFNATRVFWFIIMSLKNIIMWCGIISKIKKFSSRKWKYSSCMRFKETHFEIRIKM